MQNKNYTKPIIFPNLPSEISLRIHILRNDLLELPIPYFQCIKMLSYDQEESKDQLLDKIISSGGQNGFSAPEIELFRSEEQRDDWDIALVACQRDGTSVECKRAVSKFRTQVKQMYGRDHPLAIFIEENSLCSPSSFY